ncbi:MAG: serpin family protein [Bacteroidales bacterium]|jgi:serine protease inhibitor
MKASNIFFFALLFLSVVIVSCNKNNQGNDYGVSISAPKMVGTPAEIFSEDNINTLKISNSFNFLLLNQLLLKTDSSFNFSFSPLTMLHYIYSVDDDKYLNQLSEKFYIDDTSKLFENIITIKKLISSIDSTIKINDSSYCGKSKHTTISQKIEMPIFYEEILKAKKQIFYTSNEEKQSLEFFTIKGNLGVYSDNFYNAIDISIGNDNYSLLMIKPNNGNINQFVNDFTEKDYKTIIENLTPQITTISFPNISNSSTYSLLLPLLSFDSTYKLTPLTISSEIKIIKPTAAELKLRKTDIDNKLKKSTKAETYLFNKPFLFIIRGKSSNSILTTGVFVSK